MSSAETDSGARAVPHGMGGPSWQQYFFSGVWLIYLAQTVSGVHRHSHGPAQVVGYLLVAVFAGVYLVALPRGWQRPGRRFWVLSGVACALTVAEAFFADQHALVFVVYLAVLAVASQARLRALLVAGLALAIALLPVVIPGWGGRFDWSGLLTVALVSLAMFGFFAIINANIELTAARAEVARLAAENERTRIARDLHDLLGHSLTTITVKAGLARRLSELDPGRAGEEIAAVERLARRTLVEVRAAVDGYHEVTLAGELATSHEVLRTAGIEAQLPGAIDIVEADAVEPFGWVLREAITNVVRHSRAEHCTVTVGPRWIEVRDDGQGGGSGEGNGLSGLRERLAAVGGQVQILGGRSAGWLIRAELGPADSVAKASVGGADKGAVGGAVNTPGSGKPGADSSAAARANV